MRKLFFILVCMQVGMVSYASRTVPVVRSSYAYTVQIPEGWDTIPQAVLQTKMAQIKPDIALYPTVQGDCFKGNYVLIGFTTTMKTLTQFSFSQLTKEIEALNQKSNMQNDTLRVQYKEMVPVPEKGAIHSYFSIQKDTVALDFCQSLYLSKFGYVTVLAYAKEGAIPIREMIAQLGKVVQIKPEFQYAEPKKEGITWKHIVISLLIGLVVFGTMTLWPKLKKK